MTGYLPTITDDKGNTAVINTKIVAMFLELDRKQTGGNLVGVIDLYIEYAHEPITLKYNSRERAKAVLERLTRHIEADNTERTEDGA